MQSSRELRRIAVIGAGSAGRDVALRSVRAGFDVTLEDVMPSRLRSASQAIAQQMFASQAAPGALHLASTVEDAVRDADLAIDFLPDELESKLEIFSMLDRMAPPRTILCTPTTALSIADLASCTYRPQLCFALRFPSPGAAEIVYTSRSSHQSLSTVEHWLAALGFTVITLPDPADLAQATSHTGDPG
ncbi:MAG TPA: 3-hydroxyacyl-CoA dehydrogenase NAD-binding domain-containing protein [Acidobacteriaceae bacterium]|nr:3-hydroxyacyl-CoA dehydrogenase NAD-binding domain-containing protein [Acidobacteriaceae bacterium]